MKRSLSIELGQASSAGAKAVNQDFHGAIVPDEPALSLKGIAVAIADGISSSDHSHIAAQTAVAMFLEDYYCASEAWTAQTAGRRVIEAANAWLHGQTRAMRGTDPDRGYVTTFSAAIFKARTAHLFHVGDSRIVRLEGDSLEPLTEDHRVVLSSAESYLGRALGVKAEIEIDYRSVPLAEGDLFVLTTDGVHEHLRPSAFARAIEDEPDLDKAAHRLVDEAIERGSKDNLTIQIVRVDALPERDLSDVGAERLPTVSNLPEPNQSFDGWRIERALYASARSHVFQAVDEGTGVRAALKVPAIETRSDEQHVRRLLFEEWIAKRLSNPHLLSAVERKRPRGFAYSAMQLVEGETLRERMRRQGPFEPEEALPILSQIAAGLQAMHRRQIVHNDLKPENVMIGPGDHVVIGDFGSANAAGLTEASADTRPTLLLATLQYAAPESLLGEPITAQADVYSFGVLAYEMLTGRLPYGALMARTRTRRAQTRIVYDRASGEDSPVPIWMDAALKRAVHPGPHHRYQEPSEFLADLERPNPRLARSERPSFIERDPVRFWKIVSALLATAVLFLLIADM